MPIPAATLAAPRPLAGEIVCLISAVIWAFTIHAYRDAIAKHGPRAVNLVKCVISVFLFGATVLLFGEPAALLHIAPSDFGILIVSALLGLTIGDSAQFNAVIKIGVHPTQLLQTIAPIVATLLAVAWQGEHFNRTQGMGTALILAGVAIVVARTPRPPSAGAPHGHNEMFVDESMDLTLAEPAAPRAPDGAGPQSHLIEKSAVGAGIGLAIIAAVCQACGIVLSKEAMHRVPILEASFLRLIVGSLGLALAALLDGRLPRAWRLISSASDMKRVFPGTFFGSYVGIMLMMAGIAWAPASIAAFLLATTPVFTMAVGAITGHEPFTWRTGIGTTMTMAGIGVLTMA